MSPIGLLLLLLEPPPGPAAPSDRALSSVAEIDRRCDAAAKSATGVPERLFAEVSPDLVMPGPGKGRWRELVKKGDMAKARDDGGAPNSQARVRRFPDGVLFVELFLQSDSGDWAQFANHCYRPDGTLARLTDTLNTITPRSPDDKDDVSRIRTLYFDATGKVLRKRSRLLNLETGKPVRRSYMDQDDVVFRKVTDLPFAAKLAAH